MNQDIYFSSFHNLVFFVFFMSQCSSSHALYTREKNGNNSGIPQKLLCYAWNFIYAQDAKTKIDFVRLGKKKEWK